MWKPEHRRAAKRDGLCYLTSLAYWLTGSSGGEPGNCAPLQPRVRLQTAPLAPLYTRFGTSFGLSAPAPSGA